MLSREQVNWWRHYFHTVEDMPSNERGEAIELCDLALRSLSEPAAQVGETPRTVPVWIKSLVMQVNERVAEDATTRCTLDMENASNAVRDWQAQERELAQMAAQKAELEAKLAEKSKEVARWEKMYVCAQNSNSFRQDALDGK